MGAVFSKKSGLNMLFVGCRTMSRDDVYAARKNARASRRGTGDFCEYIKISKGFGWEIVNYTENNGFWCSLSLISDCKPTERESGELIIRWRTEGK